MKVIGITGGVASGKSLVSSQLARRGAVVLDADRLGHEVLRLPEVVVRLLDRWGPEVVTEPGGSRTGELDRAAIARRVFAPAPDGPGELKFLESVTHPHISARIVAQLDELRQEGRVAAVLDAPVLYKAKWDRYCDCILFVEAPLALRAERAAARGWSLEQLQARQQRQPDLEMQRGRADVIIDNSGRISDTVNQIEAFWNTLFPGAS